MDERWKVRLRFTVRGMLFAFLFPFAFILTMSEGTVNWSQALLAGAINSVVGGPAMTFLLVVVAPYTRRFPFVPAILIQIVSFLGTGALLIALNVAIVVAVTNRQSLTDPAVYNTTMRILTSQGMQWAFLIGIGLFFLIAMFQQVQRKLGPGVIPSWITGKYHRPREEEWVFMFLDLKDSTPLAERLGSLEFSALIQEFFNDLGWALWATRGTVSHYIGDEAVIVWRPERAFKNANCVQLFFRMQEEIAKRATFYQERFGVVPSFKAGVHIGPVVAAEVGRAKSEIVYHGDAVNTTARIVGMCAPLKCDFLVSKAIADRLSGTPYVFESLGPHELKGKAEPVELCSVSVATS